MLTKLEKGNVKIFWHVTLLYWFNNSWRFKGLSTLILRVKQSCVVCLTLTLEAQWPANRRELFTIYAAKHPTWPEL